MLTDRDRVKQARALFRELAGPPAVELAIAVVAIAWFVMLIALITLGFL